MKKTQFLPHARTRYLLHFGLQFPAHFHLSPLVPHCHSDSAIRRTALLQLQLSRVSPKNLINSGTLEKSEMS